MCVHSVGRTADMVSTAISLLFPTPSYLPHKYIFRPINHWTLVCAVPNLSYLSPFTLFISHFIYVIVRLSVCPFIHLTSFSLSLSLFVSISLSAYPCMNINSGEGSCVCSLRWAMTRCTNGIVESGSLLSLLQVS